MHAIALLLCQCGQQDRSHGRSQARQSLASAFHNNSFSSTASLKQGQTITHSLSCSQFPERFSSNRLQGFESFFSFAFVSHWSRTMCLKEISDIPCQMCCRDGYLPMITIPVDFRQGLMIFCLAASLANKYGKHNFKAAFKST